MITALLVTGSVVFGAAVVAWLMWWRLGVAAEKLEQAVWDTRPEQAVTPPAREALVAANSVAVASYRRVRHRRKFARRSAIACIIIGLIPFLVIGACGSYLAGQGGAPAAARAWVDRNRPSWYVSECQPRDTNRDGYVTCTIVGPGEAIDAIECGVDRWFHGFGVSGCKPALRGIR